MSVIQAIKTLTSRRSRRIPQPPLLDVKLEFVPSVSDRKQIMTGIRRAKSWNDVLDTMSSFGYTLFPAEEDVFAIDLDTRDVLFLGDSGHFFPFLVERLGEPPKELKPSGFYRMEAEGKHRLQSKVQGTSRMFG